MFCFVWTLSTRWQQRSSDHPEPSSVLVHQIWKRQLDCPSGAEDHQWLLQIKYVCAQFMLCIVLKLPQGNLIPGCLEFTNFNPSYSNSKRQHCMIGIKAVANYRSKAEIFLVSSHKYVRNVFSPILVRKRRPDFGESWHQPSIVLWKSLSCYKAFIAISITRMGYFPFTQVGK